MAQKGKYIYDWPRPMVTVDILIFTSLDESNPDKTGVLLINRGKEPFKSRWALPGGFVEIDEELDDAAARELEEETGLKGIELAQMHTFGTCGRDPRGRQITIVYTNFMAEIPEKLEPGDDAADVKIFNIRKLPEKLAFDHKEIIEFGLKKLRDIKVTG
jgi:8-oxo-dGTP diphosphatase